MARRGNLTRFFHFHSITDIAMTDLNAEFPAYKAVWG